MTERQTEPKHISFFADRVIPEAIHKAMRVVRKYGSEREVAEMDARWEGHRVAPPKLRRVGSGPLSVWMP
jgi:hypothetical protein